MTAPPDPALLEALTALVSRAGRAVLEARGRDLAARLKADRTPVTAADLAAQTVVLDGLKELLPDVPVVSEEAPRPDTGALARRFVLLDPLDGTKEFLAGRDEFCINLALIEAGTPVLGILCAPARGLVWRGVLPDFAERLALEPGAAPEAAHARTRIHTRPVPMAGLTALTSRSHLDPATEGFLARLPTTQRIACGSALKFGLIAEGSADLYPRLAPTSEWDIAAGHAVVAAAGGCVVSPDGAALRFGGQPGDFRVPGFVAYGDPTLAAAKV